MFHQMPLIIAAVVTATAAVLMDKARRKRRRRMRKRLMSTRRYWVHPIIQNREERGQFRILYNDLRQHEEKFFNYSRMSVNKLVPVPFLPPSYLSLTCILLSTNATVHQRHCPPILMTTNPTFDRFSPFTRTVSYYHFI